MSEAAGAINVYTCDTCQKQIVTINRVEGTTPFMLHCLATLDCQGTMQSACYRVAKGLNPTHEWFRPETKTAGQRKRLAKLNMLEHVQLGGLDIRAIVH